MYRNHVSEDPRSPSRSSYVPPTRHRPGVSKLPARVSSPHPDATRSHAGGTASGAERTDTEVSVL